MKKFQIFISSTYDDLREERNKVVATILKMNHFPIGMEMFSADNDEQWRQIQKTIDTSDYYIIIIKKRYGTITKTDGISYTEKEYEYAKTRKIPILAFIVSDAANISTHDIENDPNKMLKLQEFTNKVKEERPCDFWINSDHLCTLVAQALQKQFTFNEREGWIRSSDRFVAENLSSANENYIMNVRHMCNYEIIRRNTDNRLAYEFFDSLDEKALFTLNKQTYVDSFTRQVVIDLQNEHLARINTFTKIEYINVKNGIKYFGTNPRFMSEEQACSYRNLEYTLNGTDYLKEIKSEIIRTDRRGQFSYQVINSLPLIYSDGPIIVTHKSTYLIDPCEFFQVYQTVFPCRSFITTALIKNNENQKYRMKAATFSSFNVHTYDKYTSEYRNDDLSTITISKWSLPGSGYAIVLEAANHT